MILNATDFGKVLNASGARNFFGQGWPYHKWLGPFGPDFRGSTLVAKTTTLEPRTGKMPLGGRDGTTPREWNPRCIKVNFRRAAVLNAVGLSGPGLKAFLRDGRWQMRLEPFLLNFMAVEADPGVRLAKARQAAEMIASERPRFRAPFGIQANASCPNVGLDPSKLVREMRDALTIFRDHLPDVPLLPKFNALVPVGWAREVAAHPACSAVVVSNTIPWGALPDRIDWRGLFGDVSPLAHLGGGGLSGAPLLPIVRDWIAAARRTLFPVPIVGGGGVLSVRDANVLIEAGADAIELGSIAILRPWRVRGVIDFVNARLRHADQYQPAR